MFAEFCVREKRTTRICRMQDATCFPAPSPSFCTPSPPLPTLWPLCRRQHNASLHKHFICIKLGGSANKNSTKTAKTTKKTEKKPTKKAEKQKNAMPIA